MAKRKKQAVEATGRMTEQDLEQFSGGTENWHKCMCWRHFLWTDGVQFLVDKAEAFWLLTAVASYQKEPVIMDNPRLRQMQFWELAVPGRKEGETTLLPATLTCVEDEGIKPAVKQEFAHTDFPLPRVRIWVEEGGDQDGERDMTAMLPCER